MNGKKSSSDGIIKVKNITCIGAGYVGSLTSVVLAYKCPDIHVTIVDDNINKINAWNSSQLPIYEPQLESILRIVQGVNLKFSHEVSESLRNSDLVFICVNTPTRKDAVGRGRALDMSFLERASYQIRDSCTKKHVIVVEKSTVPVKCAEMISNILHSSSEEGTNFYVISNPEFLSEGNAVENILNPDRVIIGGKNKAENDSLAIRELERIYSSWVDVSRIISTDYYSAEISKLTSNAFLAQRVASINSISAICELSGANILEVSYAVGMDSRIGNKFLMPSLGFGGSCFKKDLLCLVYICESLGLKEVADYWHQVLAVNNYQKKRFVRLIVRTLSENIFEKCICIFGASFKKDTSDSRESPSIYVIKKLLREGAKIKVYDPCVDPSDLFENIRQSLDEKIEFENQFAFLKDPYLATESADAIVICTEWDIFKNLDYNCIYSTMKKPAFIFDGRVILDGKKLKNIGFIVKSIGISQS